MSRNRLWIEGQKSSPREDTSLASLGDPGGVHTAWVLIRALLAPHALELRALRPLAHFVRSRFARHMRLNFARFARWRTSCARASLASRASRATCAWTSRAYTSKIEDMAEKKFALRASRALRALALREPHALELRALRALGPQKLKKCLKKKNRASRATCAWSLRASRALTPQKFKKCLKKKLLHFFLKRLRRIRKS